MEMFTEGVLAGSGWLGGGHGAPFGVTEDESGAAGFFARSFVVTVDPAHVTSEISGGVPDSSPGSGCCLPLRKSFRNRALQSGH